MSVAKATRKAGRRQFGCHGQHRGKFTTVLKWEAYAAVEYEGIGYGMKAASFTPFQDLQSRVGGMLELAVGGEGTPIKELTGRGWSICNPVDLSSSLEAYQEYLQSSKSECESRLLVRVFRSYDRVGAMQYSR